MSARRQWQREADWARLRAYESGADEIVPGELPKSPCTVCTKPAVGPLCRDCINDSPDDRRVRSTP